MSPTDIFVNIFIIAFLLFVNGFFVAAEFALVKVRRTRLEQLSNEGNKNAKRALKLVENMNKMLAAAQLGVTIASIVRIPKKATQLIISNNFFLSFGCFILIASFC